MKKISYILVFTAVLLLGSIKVNASSYWQQYFDGAAVTPRKSCGGTWKGETTSNYLGVNTWENITGEHWVIAIQCGDSSSSYKFNKTILSSNLLFKASDVTLKETTNDSITADIKVYNFAQEKEYYDSYKKYYDSLKLEQINEEREYDGETAYTSKPTWWEYNEYDEEPTWNEVYGINTDDVYTEVVIRATDLGKSTLTLSANGKTDITVDVTIGVEEFAKGAMYSTKLYESKANGLIEILNNLDKYKDSYIARDSENKDYLKDNDSYDFLYEVNKDEDLSGIINALKGKDITIKFVNSGTEVSTYLNGLDIKNTVNKGFTYDSKISMESSVNKEKIDKILTSKDAIYIDFTYHGTLPTTYKLNVNVNDYFYNLYYNELKCSEASDDKIGECEKQATEKAEKYLKDEEFTLLYFNSETGKMEVVKENLKSSDGIITLDFDHFSSYVLVASDSYTITNPTNEINEEVTNPKTSFENVLAYSILFLTSLVTIGYITYKKKQIN